MTKAFYFRKMDILDRIITESINRFIRESEEDAEETLVNDETEQGKIINKHRRNGGRLVSDGERTKLKKYIDDNFIDLAQVAYQVYPDHTDEGAQSQLRKELNSERPMRIVTYQKIIQILGLASS